ncbi:hypothetical protein [Pyruvatibacter mobilis]|uniref:hypothetical protein n=1 Tax=Pyruvatibacter mobilis TaxID=1712261 RepID=UPI003C7D0609
MARILLTYILSLFIAFVFVQSLFFKFTGAEESLYIFQTIEDWSGLTFFEPGMRWVVGLSELVASILLFVPGVQVAGAVMAIGIMTGAIFFHLFTPLGIEVFGDGGTLFFLACGVWLSALVLIVLRRQQIFVFLGR